MWSVMPEDFVVWMKAKRQSSFRSNAEMARKIGIENSSLCDYLNGTTKRMEPTTVALFTRAFPELRDHAWFNAFEATMLEAAPPVADALLESITKAWPGLTAAERVKMWQYVDGIVKGRG